jgi:hypothetical protein
MASRALAFEEEDFQYQTLQGESGALPNELQVELQEFAAGSDLPVTTDEEFVVAAQYLRDEVAPRIRAVKAFFKPMKESAAKAHAAICTQEHRVLDKIVNIGDLVKKRLNDYDNAKREAAEQLARAAREEAQRQAAEQRLTEVQKKLDEGDDEAAERLLQANVVPKIAVPVVAPTAPAVKGITRQSRWVGEVVDPVAFVRWIASGTDEEVRHRLHFVEISQAELNRLAAAQRGTMQVPGVVAKEVSNMITRGKAGA